jgi:hypothetical protein
LPFDDEGMLDGNPIFSIVIQYTPLFDGDKKISITPKGMGGRA